MTAWQPVGPESDREWMARYVSACEDLAAARARLEVAHKENDWQLERHLIDLADNLAEKCRRIWGEKWGEHGQL